MPIFAPPKPSFTSFDRHADEIAGLPYWRRRLFLCNNVRPKYPRFLYKYRSVDPGAESSIKHLEDLLVHSNLWLSAPTDFNDPFDMSANIVMLGTAQERKVRLKALIKKHSVGASWKERDQKLKKMMIMPVEETEKNIRRAFERQVEKTGVCSFAEEPRSILMWSHYSFNHQGCVLQFEIARDPKTFLQAVPVEYEERYPTINWIKTDGTEIFGDILTRKHIGWRYEQEHRIVYPDGARTYLPYRHEALVGVILGCRATQETIDVIQGMIRERQKRGYTCPRLYRAQKHSSSFALTLRLL